MLFHARAAAAPLADLVDIFWSYEAAVQPHAKERLLPTGTMELIVNLNEDVVRVYDRRTMAAQTLPGAIIVGAASEFMVIDTADEISVFGVHFKPGGTLPLLGRIPANELRDQHVALEAVWGAAAAHELREQLLAAQSSRERFDVAERMLLARLDRARHPAVAYALRTIPRLRTIAEATREIGMSERRFIATFTNEVGLTPKLYSRICRFQRVLRRVHAMEQVDWADVALGCGYFDQPHFIHDFRAISGLSPGEYLEQRTPHQNHVPLR